MENSLKSDTGEQNSGAIVTIPVYSRCSDYNNNLSEVASDVTIIPLGADPPINEFQIYNIELTDDYVFLSNKSGIMQFGREGNYIKNIGREGMGPEEFINILAPLQIDRTNKLIYVNDINRQRIIVYHFDGKFEKASAFRDGGYVKHLDHSRIALRQSLSERERSGSPMIRFMDYDGNVIKTYRSHYYPIAKEEKELLGPDTSPLWNDRETYYYLEYGTDTIFGISGESLIPSRVLTGDLKLSLEEHYHRNIGNKLRIITYIQRPDAGVFESDRFLIFRLSSDYERFFMVYDKMNNRLHRTFYTHAKEVRQGEKEMAHFTDDIISGLSFNPQYQSEGKAIALIPAWEVCERRQEVLDFINRHPEYKQFEQLKSVIQNLTDDDNPLMMLVTFK